MIITGNPSCGKTTVIQKLLSSYPSLNITTSENLYDIKRN